jgi:hypothetical protein
VLTLSRRASKIFVNAILNPPLPNEALRAAARRYKAEMEDARPKCQSQSSSNPKSADTRSQPPLMRQQFEDALRQVSHKITAKKK